ncbi:MAG: helix-turn-helix domain-containing protein [Alphaproteobacteria bacterium]|nr:helix-turn-helix domain-containing protein [Alphaproteobacteria bacterium]
MLDIRKDRVTSPEIFQGVAVDRPLDGEVSHRLFCISSIRSVPAKEVVYCQGDASDYVYEVIEGVVKLYMLTADGRLQIMGFAFPGQILALDTDSHHLTTAEAVTQAKLCQYPRAKFEQVIDEHPQLARQLFAIVAQDLSVARSQMLLLGRKSATERLASFLLDLSERNATRGENPDLIALPMSRGDIGDYLGLTIETVSRTMTRLRQLGVLDLNQHRRVAIRDRARLCEMAEDGEFSC